MRHFRARIEVDSAGPRRQAAAGYAAGLASHSFSFDQRRRYSRRPLAAIATALGRAPSTDLPRLIGPAQR